MKRDERMRRAVHARVDAGAAAPSVASRDGASPDDLFRDPVQAQRLRRVSALISDFAYSVEIAPDGRFRNHWLSEAFERVFGYSYDELKDLGWRQLVISEDQEKTHDRLEALLEGRSFEGEFRIRARDGSLRWIHDQARSLTDASGRVVEIYGAARDVTERRQAEEKLRVHRRAQRLESLGSLAAGIAHDFNNILVGVLGHADLALDLLPDGSEARESVEEAGRGAQHAADLAQQLLDFAGEARGRAERLDLSSVVAEMEKLLRVSVRRRARVTCVLADDLPPVLGDRGQLRQVVMNLILNAADALEGRFGSIHVRTALLPGTVEDDETPPALPFESWVFDQDYRGDPSSDCVELEVADDGCGMDEETRRRLFEPFYTTKPTGRGLGMATVLGVVRAHRGAIRVASKEGEGTTICVALPIAAAA